LVEDNFEKLSNNLLKSNIESDFKQEYKIQIIFNLFNEDRISGHPLNNKFVIV